jgi:hypothetical protein
LSGLFIGPLEPVLDRKKLSGVIHLLAVGQFSGPEQAMVFLP